MSTMSEIEAALPLLSPDELREVERAARGLREGMSGQMSAEAKKKLRLLEKLQESLQLDDRKTEAWLKTIHEARV